MTYQRSALFGTGQTPTISIVNKATVSLGIDLNALGDACNQFAAIVASIWGTPAQVRATQTPDPQDWVINLVDTLDVDGALGYHNLTAQGMPQGWIGVKVCLQYDGNISMCTTHELAEMLVDPGISTAVYGPGGRLGRFYSYESADPVEQNGFKINNVIVTDFILPSWFEYWRPGGSTRFDYLGLLDSPLSLLQGGYYGYFDIYQRKWVQSFGSKQARDHYYATRGKPGTRSWARMHSLVAA